MALLPFHDLPAPRTGQQALVGFGDALRQMRLDEERRNEALSSMLAQERKTAAYEEQIAAMNAKLAWEMAKEMEGLRHAHAAAQSAASKFQLEQQIELMEKGYDLLKQGDVQGAAAIFQSARGMSPAAPPVAGPAAFRAAAPAPQMPQVLPQIKPNGQPVVQPPPKPMIRGASALPDELEFPTSEQAAAAEETAPPEPYKPVAETGAPPQYIGSGPMPSGVRRSAIVRMARDMGVEGIFNENPAHQLEVAVQLVDAGARELPDRKYIETISHAILAAKARDAEQKMPPEAPVPAVESAPGQPPAAPQIQAPEPTSEQRLAMAILAGGRPVYTEKQLSALPPEMRAIMGGQTRGPSFDELLTQFRGMAAEAAGTPRVIEYAAPGAPDVDPIKEARRRRWAEIIESAKAGAGTLSGKPFYDAVMSMAPRSEEQRGLTDPDMMLKEVFHKYGKQPPPVSIVARSGLELSKDKEVESRLMRVITNFKQPEKIQEMFDVVKGIQSLGPGSVGPEQAGAIMALARKANGPGVLTNQDLIFVAKGRAGLLAELTDIIEGKVTGGFSQETVNAMSAALKHGLARTMNEARKAQAQFESRAVSLFRDPKYGFEFEPTVTGLHETYFGWLPNYSTPDWIGLMQTKPQAEQKTAAPGSTPQRGGSVSVSVRGPADEVTKPGFNEITNDVIKSLRVRGLVR